MAVRESGDGYSTLSLVPAFAKDRVIAPVGSPRSSTAAALTPDRRTLLVGSTDGRLQRREALTGQALVPPSVDQFGWIWTADSERPGELLAVNESGGAEHSSALLNLADGDEICSASLGLGSTQLALLIKRDGRLLLGESAVVRSRKGDPTGLSTVQTMPLPVNGSGELCWYSEQAMIVFVPAAEGQSPQAIIWDSTRGVQRVPPPPRRTPVRASALSTRRVVPRRAGRRAPPCAPSQHDAHACHHPHRSAVPRRCSAADGLPLRRRREGVVRGLRRGARDGRRAGR